MKDISVPAGAAPIASRRDQLLKLAKRCEGEKASDALDEAITRSVATHSVATAPHIVIYPYTTSRDEAVTLVPEGAWRETNGPRRYLNIPTSVPNFWRCHVFLWEPTYGDFHGWAATEAMAICAAALRARAAAPVAATEEQGRSVIAEHANNLKEE